MADCPQGQQTVNCVSVTHGEVVERTCDCLTDGIKTGILRCTTHQGAPPREVHQGSDHTALILLGGGVGLVAVYGLTRRR